MGKYTIQQRIEIIQRYFENSRSIVKTLRAISPSFGRYNIPSRQHVHSLVQKFESTGSVADIPTPVRLRSARLNENIAAVRASVAMRPNLSIPRRAQELGLSVTSTWRILREDLGMYPHSSLSEETQQSQKLKTEASESNKEKHNADALDKTYYENNRNNEKCTIGTPTNVALNIKTQYAGRHLKKGIAKKRSAKSSESDDGISRKCCRPPISCNASKSVTGNSPELQKTAAKAEREAEAIKSDAELEKLEESRDELEETEEN